MNASMNIISVKDHGTVIAQIIKHADWPQGLNFFSEEQDFLQISTWNYDVGKHLKAHAHKIHKRISTRTHELIFVKQGKMEAHFYEENDTYIATYELCAGDIVIIYGGGHAYDILQDSTQILEVKNGPYPGIEKDKKVIEQ